MPAARRDEKFKLAKHFCHYARASIIPIQNPLSRVASADERELGLCAIMVSALARDVDEQSVAGGRDGVRNGQSGGLQHLHPLFQCRTGIILMGEYSRNDIKDQIYALAGRLGQFDVRYRRRVKAAC